MFPPCWVFEHETFSNSVDEEGMLGGCAPKTGRAKATQRARPAHRRAMGRALPESIRRASQSDAATLAAHAATTENACAWRLIVSMAPAATGTTLRRAEEG